MNKLSNMSAKEQVVKQLEKFTNATAFRVSGMRKVRGVDVWEITIHSDGVRLLERQLQALRDASAIGDWRVVGVTKLLGKHVRIVSFHGGAADMCAWYRVAAK